ncbi:hypothetical protein SAMN04489713_104257 [Actinomadura madurae]|uniref:Uncharacterized protein n=1 Tax=Actinomadura madurae TaxID=1993 RepID=A0A1I5ES30_9ACTN|nr:hypothetical protein [Actinomadura madurae]SFO14325.1 hypothetical protein SAMN04489713_104257 [Actinomadura madurae]
MSRRAVEVDGDVSDLLVMFAQRFPGWAFARTDAGWYATRGGLVRETLRPDGRGTVKASTPAELLVKLERAER